MPELNWFNIFTLRLDPVAWESEGWEATSFVFQVDVFRRAQEKRKMLKKSKETATWPSDTKQTGPEKFKFRALDFLKKYLLIILIVLERIELVIDLKSFEFFGLKKTEETLDGFTQRPHTCN